VVLLLVFDLQLRDVLYRVGVWASLSKGYKPSIDKKVIVDTGNTNTVISKELAEIYGFPYLDKSGQQIVSTTRLGGRTYTTKMYVIPKIIFDKKFTINAVFVEAIDFPSNYELYDSILLGLNVLNNWEYKINRVTKQLSVEENIPPFITKKSFIYQNHFDKKTGKYVYFSETFPNASKGSDPKNLHTLDKNDNPIPVTASEAEDDTLSPSRRFN